MPKYKAAIFLLLVLATTPVYSLTVSDQESNQKIVIPKIPGFAEVRAESDLALQAKKAIEIGGIELLALLLPEEDIARLLLDGEPEEGKNIILGTLKTPGLDLVDETSFDSVKDEIREDFHNFGNSEKEVLIARTINESKEIYPEVIGWDPEMSDLVFLGIDSESNEHMSWTAFVRSRLEYLGESLQVLQSNTSGLVLIEGRVIYLKVTTLYFNKNDLLWGRETAKSIIRSFGVDNFEAPRANLEAIGAPQKPPVSVNKEFSSQLAPVIVLLLAVLGVTSTYHLNRLATNRDELQNSIDNSKATGFILVLVFLATVFIELVLAYTYWDVFDSKSKIISGMASIDLADHAEARSHYRNASLFSFLLSLKSVVILGGFCTLVVTSNIRTQNRRKTELKEVNPEKIKPAIEMVESLLSQANVKDIKIRFWLRKSNSVTPSVFQSNGYYNFVFPLAFNKLVRSDIDSARAMIAHEIGHIIQGDLWLWKASVLASKTFTYLIIPSTLLSLGVLALGGEEVFLQLGFNSLFLLLLIQFMFYRIILMARQKSEDMADCYSVRLVGRKHLASSIEKYLADVKSKFHRSKLDRISRVGVISVKSAWHIYLWLCVFVGIAQLIGWSLVFSGAVGLPNWIVIRYVVLLSEVPDTLLFLHASLLIGYIVFLSARHRIGYYLFTLSTVVTFVVYFYTVPNWTIDYYLFSMLHVVLMAPSLLFNFGRGSGT